MGVTIVHCTCVVPCCDASVGVPEPSSSDQDAMRVGDPAGVRGSQVVRGDVAQPGSSDGQDKPAAEPVVPAQPDRHADTNVGSPEMI